MTILIENTEESWF